MEGATSRGEALAVREDGAVFEDFEPRRRAGPLRIAMLTELYVPSLGGQEVRFAELAAALRRRDHVVSVFCMRHDRRLPAGEILDGVRVRRHPLVPDFRKSWVPGMPRGVVPILRYSLWCRRALATGGAFDLYVFNQFPFGHVLAAPPWVRHRSIVDWCEVRPSPVFRLLQRRLPRLAAANMAVSTAAASRISAQSGCPVTYLPSGVEADRYHCLPADERSGVLYVGRLRPHKRLPLLVDAYGLLRRTGFSGPLTIAGSGQSQIEVDRAVQGLPPEARAHVRLPGPVSEDEKIRLLGSSRVLVVPSQREGFPRIVAEAMASGLPVVTTSDAGNGTADVVREHDIGVVCNPSTEAVAEGVRQVVADWDRYSANARARAADLDWDRLVETFEHIAAALLSARPR